jgi:uncharacterized protein (DUF58 family)
MPSEFETYRLATKRNALLFMTSFALAAGFGFNVRPLIFVAECLVVLTLYAWWTSGQRRRKYKFTRRHYPRCFENDVVRVGLQCRFKDRARLYLVEVRDTFPPGSAYYVSNLAIRLQPGHVLELIYDNLCSHRRGLYTIGPLHLHVADPLGIFPHQYEFPVFTSLYVYPQAPQVDGFDLLEEGTLRHVGQEVVSRAGRSEEFRSIRDYRPGDPLSLIHWPSTARHGRPMVKEFDENIVTDVTIFLDLHRLSLRGLGDVTSIEYMIKAAVATARTAIDRAHRVQVFAVGQQIDHVPPGGGSPHLLTILDRMTLYRANGDHDFVEEVLKRIAFLPRGGTAVLIVSATNFDLDRMQPVIEQLIEDRMRVITILIDDRSFLKLYLEQETKHVRAPKLPEIVRQLKQAGSRVVTVAINDDLQVRMEMME